METPSSATRRIIRSQAYAAANNSDNVSVHKKIGEESLKSRQQDRSALIDITNDSPIVGVAKGKLGTPSTKKGIGYNINTPGSESDSGEALLRCQVKNLLQKVEAAEISKPRIHLLQGQFFNSPMCHLAAPTPANTPQIISNPSAILSDNNSSTAILDSVVVIPFSQGESETETDVMVTRSLMLEFSEKIEFEEETGGDADAELVDELCQAISKINVNGKAKFCGKHTKFVYNSDDELEGEIDDESSSAFKLKLQGWPSPKGKHFRFSEDNV